MKRKLLHLAALCGVCLAALPPVSAASEFPVGTWRQDSEDGMVLGVTEKGTINLRVPGGCNYTSGTLSLDGTFMLRGPRTVMACSSERMARDNNYSFEGYRNWRLESPEVMLIAYDPAGNGIRLVRDKDRP